MIEATFQQSQVNSVKILWLVVYICLSKFNHIHVLVKTYAV